MLLMLAGPARADRAEELQQEGVFRFNTGKHQKSLALLSQAVRATRDPKLLARIYLYIGLNHAVLGKEAQAKKAFGVALGHNTELRLDPNRFKPALVKLLDSVRSTLQGELVVEASRPDAVVLVDGKEVGKVPWKGQISIGPHHVAVRTVDDTYGFLGKVVIATKQTTRIMAQLTPLRPPTAASMPANVPMRPAPKEPGWVGRPGMKAPIVAVFGLQDQTGKLTSRALQQLTDYLTGKMAEGGFFQLIPGSRVKQRLVEQRKESYRVCYDQQCQIDIGRELAAQKTLSTQVLEVGSRCAVISTMYDLKRATTEMSASERCGCGQDEMVSALEQVASALKGQLALQVPASGGSLKMNVTVKEAAILAVRSKPYGAKFWIDGREVGETPAEVPVPPGTHRVKVAIKGQKAVEREVRAEKGKVAVVSVSLGPEVVPAGQAGRPGQDVDEEEKEEKAAAPRRRVWTWVAAGSAAAAAIVAIGLWASARSEYNEYQDKDTTRARGANLKGSIESKARGANAMYGIAGALAVTSVALYFLEGRQARQASRESKADRKQSRRSTLVAPMVGRVSGVLLTTRF